MPTKIQSSERTLDLLEYLNANNGSSLREIGEALNLTRGTAFRLVETIRAKGFLRKEPGSKYYWLTGHVLALSSGYSGDHWIEQIARPIVFGLGDALQWPVRLTTLSSSAVVVRLSTDHISPFTFDKVFSGRKVSPFTTASGHIFLAYCPEKQLDRIVNHFSDRLFESAASVDLIKERNKKIRERGYQQTDLTQTGMLAVPVLCENTIVGCLSVQYFRRNISSFEGIERFLNPLRESAEEIGEEILRLRSAKSED